MPSNEIYTDTDNESVNPDITERESNEFETPEQERAATILEACEGIVEMYKCCPHPEVVESAGDGIKCRQIDIGLYAAMQVLKEIRERNNQQNQNA